jgi:flagellar assembly factor FliW
MPATAAFPPYARATAPDALVTPPDVWVDTVTVPSAVLGPVAVRDTDRVHFAAGLYGFAGARDFALLPAGHAGLWWLQSVVEPGLVFLLADPFAAFPDYAPDVPDAEVAALGEGLAPAPDRVALFAVVTLSADGAASANLRAPVLVDVRARRARQVVLPAEARGVAEPFALPAAAAA